MTDVLEHPETGGLPVLDALAGVRGALAEGGPGAAVLVAPPGAGKTTVVPLALLGESWLAEGRIVVLEPRRLAARAAAARMATLVGEAGPGGTVGYRVRGDTRVSASTRVEVVTEGVLTRMLQSDPSLAGVGLVVFDEFHERSVHADLGLALTLHSRSLLRPELRVLVMSATLDAAPVAALLGEAPVVRSEGRAYPVETRWRRSPVEGWIEPAAASAVVRALEEVPEGDVLVFLPGAGEIRRTERRLASRGLPGTVAVHALYGRLGQREQDAALAPSPSGRRKVVLATSIAETSLTIEGVRVVVDAGLMRVPRFDPGTGMTRLETRRVTRDAADQRRGRAGRMAPGVAYRLWTRAEDRGLVPHRRPEILEADLAPLALELAAWGAAPDELRWLDAPPAAAYAQALELLEELDAVEPPPGIDERADADDALTAPIAATPHGRRLARLGLHPRLAHMMVRGEALGLGDLACDLAAVLAERDILRGDGRAPDADLRLRVDALRGRRSGRVDRAGAQRVKREAERLRRALRGLSEAGTAAADEAAANQAAASARGAAAAADAPAEPVGLLTALAYPDRIGQRRPDARGRFLLRNGRGARFAEPQSLAGADWLVAAEVEGSGVEARIFRAAPVALRDLEAHFARQLRTVEEVAWDERAGRVVARRRRVLGALTLAESPLAEPDPDALAGALVVGLRAAGPSALPWTKETRQLRERLAFLHALEPEAWPDVSEAALMATLDGWLRPFLAGRRRLEELKRVDLAEALLAGVPWSQRSRLEALAPTHVEVPSGSRIRVDYGDPAAPTLAVRLQEVFGLEATPRVGGGRVPLTLALLSPAQRPVQVTQDLASFWRDAYFEVRKDLRGRYPKHYWPENPLEAEPTRRTRPRK